MSLRHYMDEAEALPVIVIIRLLSWSSSICLDAQLRLAGLRIGLPRDVRSLALLCIPYLRHRGLNRGFRHDEDPKLANLSLCILEIGEWLHLVSRVPGRYEGSRLSLWHREVSGRRQSSFAAYMGPGLVQRIIR